MIQISWGQILMGEEWWEGVWFTVVIDV